MEPSSEGSKLQSEALSPAGSAVELIQAQFPRFAGVLGVRRRRHGNRTTAAPPRRRVGWRMGKGVRGPGPRADRPPGLPAAPQRSPLTRSLSAPQPPQRAPGT